MMRSDSVSGTPDGETVLEVVSTAITASCLLFITIVLSSAVFLLLAVLNYPWGVSAAGSVAVAAATLLFPPVKHGSVGVSFQRLMRGFLAGASTTGVVVVFGVLGWAAVTNANPKPLPQPRSAPTEATVAGPFQTPVVSLDSDWSITNISVTKSTINVVFLYDRVSGVLTEPAVAFANFQGSSKWYPALATQETPAKNRFAQSIEIPSEELIVSSPSIDIAVVTLSEPAFSNYKKYASEIGASGRNVGWDGLPVGAVLVSKVTYALR